MSAFQYFDFRTLDAPLSADQMQEIRHLLPRAKVTPQRVQLSLGFGAFPTDIDAFFLANFDAMLHWSSGGNKTLAFRFPAILMGRADWEPLVFDWTERNLEIHYGLSASWHGQQGLVKIFTADPEEEDYVQEEGETLSALLPLRHDWLKGKFIALYLFWLDCQYRIFQHDSEHEPILPPLPAAQDDSEAVAAFADFFGVERWVMQAVANFSLSADAAERALTDAIVQLPSAEQTTWLRAWLSGEPYAEMRLRQRLREGSASLTAPAPPPWAEWLQWVPQRRN